MSGDCTSCDAWREMYAHLSGAVASTALWVQERIDDPKRLPQSFIFELQERLHDALAGR